MRAQSLGRKKKIESHYMAEAQKASALFPVGTLVPHEGPDFLLHSDHGTIGIEMTELCQEEPRAEAGRLAKVATKAHELFRRLPNSHPVDVRAAFAPNIKNLTFQQLVKGLTDFVFVHQHTFGGFNWNEQKLPEGYCYIGLHEPMNSIGQWRTTRAFNVALAKRQLLDDCIQAKHKRLSTYRTAAAEVWLLIVNDTFLGAGEVYARPDYLEQWRFRFDFDKVLLFSREINGSGQVIELRHA